MAVKNLTRSSFFFLLVYLPILQFHILRVIQNFASTYHTLPTHRSFSQPVCTTCPPAPHTPLHNSGPAGH